MVTKNIKRTVQRKAKIKNKTFLVVRIYNLMKKNFKSKMPILIRKNGYVEKGKKKCRKKTLTFKNF